MRNYLPPQLGEKTLKSVPTSATGENVSPAKLWENVYAIMMDAVTRNLNIETEVAKQLGSSHIPFHILCKSHTCEKLDLTCIDTLVKIKEELKYSELLG